MRMERICLVAMNYINEDLKFTTEVEEDFQDKKLPTLDFSLWLICGLIYHTYFEKMMRTPYIIMRRSAMSKHQMMSILSNELVRRLSNVHPDIRKEESLGITEHYTIQLKMSGYSRKKIRDVLPSGITGWIRKIERRKKDTVEFCRAARTTLGVRTRKKLAKKTTWFRQKMGKNEEIQMMGSKRQKMHKAEKWQVTKPGLP